MLALTTHVNTDFDALASMVAASFLYPQGIRILPSQLTPQVREFVAVHWDLLRLKARKSIDINDICELIVTDTSSWKRLDAMHELAERTDVSTIVWDHHPGPGSIEASEMHQAELGAAVTLILEEMKARDCAFSPVHATLFLLGIYEDTGSLSFPSTTTRDVLMAGFLLENGADLNVVSAYLDSPLDDRHLDLFSRMLESSDVFTVGGMQLGIWNQDVDKGLNMLPTVVNKFKEIKGLDAAFGVFPMSAHKTAVIGRGRAQGLDIGALMRQFGGGGHAGAGSAIFKGSGDQVRSQLVALLHSAEVDEIRVQDLMTVVQEFLGPGTTLRTAGEILDRTGRHALLVLDENGGLLGQVGEAQLAKIRHERQWDKPASSMLNPRVPLVHPQDSLRHALHLMSHSEAGFLPVIQDARLVGEITRAAIILQMYDF